MASILKIDVLQPRYANTGILLDSLLRGASGTIINEKGEILLPPNLESANTFSANTLVSNTITANSYSGITLDMITGITATATANQVLTADGSGNFFFQNNASEVISSITDLSISDGTVGQVLTTHGNGSFFFAAASDPIAVKKTNSSNAILSTVTNVNDFRFDSDSGFDVIDLGSGAVKIQMNSTFKTLKVSGQTDLVATGLDILELVGSGVTITTNASANPKTLTFTAASTLTDLSITDGTANQVLITDGSGNFSFANTAAKLSELSDVDSSATANQVLTADGSGSFSFANAASGGASTLTDLGIADGTSDQVLTTDGNGTFTFGHTLSVLNQDLVDGGLISELRDFRTIIDMGDFSSREGGGSAGGSSVILKSNATTVETSTGTSVISESNGNAKLENITVDLRDKTDAIIVPRGTTAQRPSSALSGMIRYNTTQNYYEIYESSNTWVRINGNSPIVDTITPNYLANSSAEAGATQTLQITGLEFDSGATVRLIPNNGATNIVPASVSYSNTTHLTATFNTSDILQAHEPYDLRVTNETGAFGVKFDCIYVDNKPTWTINNGDVLATLSPVFRNYVNVSLATAVDPDGDTVTYAMTGAPSQLTINATSGVISNAISLPETYSALTTYSFTAKAQSTGSDPGATQVSTNRTVNIRQQGSLHKSVLFDGTNDYLYVDFGTKNAGATDNNGSQIRKCFVFSAFVKLSSLGQLAIFGATDDVNNRDVLRFRNSFIEYQIVTGGTSYTWTSTAKYKDVGSWYHVYLQVDHGTDSNPYPKITVEVNDFVALKAGDPSVGSIGSNDYGPAFTTSINPNINRNIRHYIGARATTSIFSPELFFDGYITDVHFFDGHQLSAYEIVHSTNRVYLPKIPTPSDGDLAYGTNESRPHNGFYLDFSDITGTTVRHKYNSQWDSTSKYWTASGF